MDKKIPFIYLLHGDDRVGMHGFIDSMVLKMGDPNTAQMNISRLRVGIDTDSDLRSACLALPFLTGRRLVILEGFTEYVAINTGWTKRKAKSTKTELEAGKQLIDFFEQIPSTTALVLLAEDEWIKEKGSWHWKVFQDSHWMVKWSKSRSDIVYYRCFNLPRGNEMASWLIDRAEKMGGKITPAGAQALALATGNDTQLGCQELEKMLAFVNDQRPIEFEDVQKLTAPIVTEDVFVMADAIGRRDAQKALKALHILLADSSPEELMGMITRQIRLLIIVKEARRNSLTSADICGMIRLPAAITQKYVNQSLGFEFGELFDIYHRLLDIDEANKSGGMPIETALDTLIATLANRVD